LRKHVSMTLLEVSLPCLHFSIMVSEGEVKSPYFLHVCLWWALHVSVKAFFSPKLHYMYIQYSSRHSLINIWHPLPGIYCFVI
jgi:hypothetical protein